MGREPIHEYPRPAPAERPGISGLRSRSKKSRSTRPLGLEPTTLRDLHPKTIRSRRGCFLETRDFKNLQSQRPLRTAPERAELNQARQRRTRFCFDQGKVTRFSLLAPVPADTFPARCEMRCLADSSH